MFFGRLQRSNDSDQFKSLIINTCILQKLIESKVASIKVSGILSKFCPKATKLSPKIIFPKLNASEIFGT